MTGIPRNNSNPCKLSATNPCRHLFPLDFDRQRWGASSLLFTRSTPFLAAKTMPGQCLHEKDEKRWAVGLVVSSIDLRLIEKILNDETSLLFGFGLPPFSPPSGWPNSGTFSFHLPPTRFYVAGVAFALEHMHDRRIVYRDVKPECLGRKAVMPVSLWRLGRLRAPCAFGLVSSPSHRWEFTTSASAVFLWACVPRNILLDHNGCVKLSATWLYLRSAGMLWPMTPSLMHSNFLSKKPPECWCLGAKGHGLCQVCHK